MFGAFAKNAARWSKLHFTSTDDHSRKEQISRIKQNFYTFLRIRASNLRSLVTTSCTVVRTAFYMYKRTIQEIFDVWEQSLLFLSLLNFNQNMFGVFAKKYGTVVKTAIHFNGWSFQERTNLSNKAELLHFFENSSVKFKEFGDNFMHGCQDCILHVQTNNSRNFWCLGKKFTVFITFEF